MSKLQFRYPNAIVSTDWLADNINAPDLRVFDCTTYLNYNAKSKQPYDVTSGWSDYNQSHIPGATLLDIQRDLSDNDNPYLFAIPNVEDLAIAFARQGVSNESRVILYARDNPQWATRVWWMLNYIGFDNAAILDGGIIKWGQERRAISSGHEHYAPASLSTNARREVFVGKNDVLDAIKNDNYCTISALSPDLHSGKNPRYGRCGRIPASINVPAVCLVNSQDTSLISPQDASAVFGNAGASASQKIITYCGSGIWAAMNAFVLYQLGYDNVAVYDNSMSEWASDINLPVEVD